jgi:uncharacterized protein YecE (DUF72 family)
LLSSAAEITFRQPRLLCLLRRIVSQQGIGRSCFSCHPISRNVDVLSSFLRELPAIRAAFEFRHESWLDEEIFSLLRERNIALCIADSEKLAAPTVVTADYGYLRLRREDYTRDDVARWADVVRQNQASWRDAFVYFKHEEAGLGPKLAGQMIELLA